MTDSETTPEQLHEQIEATRMELGYTIHDLAAKADVADVANRAHDTVQSAAHTLRDKAVATAAEAQEAATGIVHQVRDKVPEPVRHTAAAAQAHLADTAASVTRMVQDRTPPRVRTKAERIAATVRLHLPEILMAAAAGAVALGARLRRRHGSSGVKS